MSDTAPKETAQPAEALPPPEPEPDTAPRRPKRSRTNKKGAPRTPAQQAALAKAQAARRGSGSSKTKAPGAMTPAQLRKALTDTINSTAGALMVAGVMGSPRLAYDGEIIAGKADELAAELVALAEKNPRIYAALTTLVTAGQWAKIGGLAAGIAVPIAANHGLLPRETATLVGAPMPPERPAKPEPEPEASSNGAEPSPAPGPAWPTAT